MDTEVRDILDEFGQLKTSEERQNVENVWDEIKTYVVPYMTDFDESSVQKGTRDYSEIYDGTAISALNTYANGCQGHLLSGNFTWFSTRVPEERLMDDREVRMWLSFVDQVLIGLLQRSNFYPQIRELFKGGGSYGTPTMHCWFDKATRREWFMMCHPREIYIAEDDNGEADTHFHFYVMSYKRALERFGESNLDKEVVKKAKGREKFEDFKVLRVVRPRLDWNPNKADSKSMRFASIYVDYDRQKKIREGGLNLTRYMSWRVEKNPDETYGRGPGWTALADIKALYTYAKTDIQAAQLMVNPPLDIPVEREGDILYVPGGRNYYDDAGRPVQMMNTNVNLRAGLDREERKQQIIEKHFMVPFFLAMQSMDSQARERTREEVRRRHEEQSIMLGPHIAGLNQEVLDKLIDILFRDAWDAGMIPPPPRILLESGTHIEVDYMGPLAKAQRAYFHAEPYRQSLSDIMGLANLMVAAGRSPDFLDFYNFDYISQEMSKSNGMPEEAMYEKEQVEQARAQRAQQQAQAQQLAAMEQAGKAIPGLNQPVNEDSVLAAMENG